MEVTYIDHMGTDLSVVNAAKVSFKKKAEKFSESHKGLINYLAKHEHFSPFNHTFITMHVKAPIFVARQLVKHEYMPWNEVSRRYVDDEPEFYEPEVWRAKAENVKQGSDPTLCIYNKSDNPAGVVHEEALHTYRSLLDAGVCAEQARMVLPQSMYTEWYWSGTLKAWAKMYNLRIDSHAQKETQEVAKQAGAILAPLFPVAWKALTQ